MVLNRLSSIRFAAILALGLNIGGCAVISTTASIATTGVGAAATAGSVAISGAGAVAGAGASAVKAGASAVSTEK